MKPVVLPDSFRQNVPLAPYTTLGIGGPARFLVKAETEAQVIDALKFAASAGLPIFVLGRGSNTVVSDTGFPGLVVQIALRGIRMQGGGTVTAAAGEDWDELVRTCVESGLAGIECLSGIPGTVGGTPIQNVGAYGQDAGDVITSVRVLDRRRMQVTDLLREECGFSYRQSVFNSTLRERYVILAVTFDLHPDAPPRIDYPDLRKSFSDRSAGPSLGEVRAAVLRIRESKAMVLRPGDADSRSAGSFFKNPIVTRERAAEIEAAARRSGSLQEGVPMPHYPAADGRVKLSAAWIIEEAGFRRGCGRGRIGLSSRHALALINRGGASARELLDFTEEIREAVRNRFGLELIPEPVFVGF